MIARLADGASRRALGLLAAVFAVLAIAPFVVNDYLLTVMIVALYLAYTGQAWNIMMGFAGQLSLGNAIYAGLGAYVAAVLFTRYGIAPWLGLLAAIPVAAACAAIIGFLAFRFGVAGVYFAILTIAFAEFARVGFDHLEFVHASAGLFLPVTQYTHDDLWRLRGNPTMFYYVILAATAVAFLLSRALLKSRIGYFWLAIREDEQAARAAGIDTFRYKMYALMISAGVTSFAGVFYAFFYNNLFPEQVFNITQSIEMILGPIIGGVGTLFGPVLGAFVLTGMAESVTSIMAALGFDLPGAKQVFYGICLLLVVVALPEGIWPPLARRLGIDRVASIGPASIRTGDDGAAFARSPQQTLPRSGRRRWRKLLGTRGRDLCGDWSERRRQDDAVQYDRRRDTAQFRHSQFCRRGYYRSRARRGVPPRHRPHVPAGAPVSGAEPRG